MGHNRLAEALRSVVRSAFGGCEVLWRRRLSAVRFALVHKKAREDDVRINSVWVGGTKTREIGLLDGRTADLVDENGPVTTETGAPVSRVAIVRIEDGTVHRTWNTMGMRGTASHDAEFIDLFVPASHTYVRTEPPVHENPLYNPQTAILCSWTLAAANALGMARGAMDAFMQLATAGSTTSPKLLRDRTTVQTTVGECEAIIGAGRSYVLSAVGAMWESQVAKAPDLMDKAVHARLSIAHAIRQSVNVVDMLFYAAGTGAIHRSNGLERFFRDLHVSGQHISGLHSNYELGGQLLLGAEPTAPTYS